MKVVLAVGHWKDAPGAVNKTTGLTEFYFNSVVASGVKLLATRLGYDVEIFYRVNNDLHDLVRRINEFRPDLAIELHCNSCRGNASGSEVLFWHSNRRMEIIAEEMADQFALAICIPSRGAKPVKKGDRGWLFLGKTKCHALLCEPFFISNDKDLKQAMINMGKLVTVYVNTIKRLEETL